MKVIVLSKVQPLNMCFNRFMDDWGQRSFGWVFWGI